jgi:hypothetical protein
MISRVLLSTSAPPTSAATPSGHRRTMSICPTKVAPTGVIVEPDPTLDGLGRHLREEIDDRTVRWPTYRFTSWVRARSAYPNCRSEHSADGVYGERALAVGCPRQRLGAAGCDRRSLMRLPAPEDKRPSPSFVCALRISRHIAPSRNRPSGCEPARHGRRNGAVFSARRAAGGTSRTSPVESQRGVETAA